MAPAYLGLMYGKSHRGCFFFLAWLINAHFCLSFRTLLFKVVIRIYNWKYLIFSNQLQCFLELFIIYFKINQHHCCVSVTMHNVLPKRKSRWKLFTSWCNLSETGYSMRQIFVKNWLDCEKWVYQNEGRGLKEWFRIRTLSKHEINAFLIGFQQLTTAVRWWNYTTMSTKKPKSWFMPLKSNCVL